MVKLGVNRDNQKKQNRGLTLKLIATGQCISRADLARSTGLTKPAITQIVNELIDKNYLIEKEKDNTVELGRSPIKLGISPDAPDYVGVLIQRDYCEAVLCDMQLHIKKRERIYQEWTSAGELMEGVFKLVDHMLEGADHVLGIGAASIGPVSVKEGIMTHPLYFHDIKNVRVRSLLEERYKMPVFFDHDNQSAVLAEHLYGSGRDYQDILLVSVGAGVGCGILVNGKRIHSYSGSAPEIGHVSIDCNGKKCVCGNVGCLECYVNSRTIMERFREATALDCTYEEFCNMTDYKAINAIMCDQVDKLTNGIVNVLNVMNSQIVILGLDCVYWPEKYIYNLEDYINRKKFGNENTRIVVRKAYFMEQTQVLGAVCNAINQTFNGELM